VFADAHLQHVIPAHRRRQAESGESEVSLDIEASLGGVRRMYVVAHYALSID
jgi:hypothetical protein